MAKLSQRVKSIENDEDYDAARTNGWHEDTAMTNGIDYGGSTEANGVLDKEELDHALGVIAEGPYTFLSQQETTSHWSIDKYGLSKWLREKEIMGMIGERTDKIGMRVIRMMADKGKLDEKNLQELGLLNSKHLRWCLGQLHSWGLIELQEVPRDPQRQPVRTMFLWFFDPDRAQKVLLGELYKTMARCYQHLQLEREKVSTTLDKVERLDVADHEDEMLSNGERLVLRQFRRKERGLMGESFRLDDSVALLRAI